MTPTQVSYEIILMSDAPHSGALDISEMGTQLPIEWLQDVPRDYLLMRPS